MIYHNIEEVLTDDNLWRRMALKRTRCKVQADELVHRFYMEYSKVKDLKPDKQINQGYVFRALRNLWIKEITYQNKLSNSFCEGDFYNKQYTTDDFNFDEEYDFESDNLRQAQIDLILKELDKIDLFHRTIYKYVVMEGISMRQLAKDTTIHYNKIQKAVVATTKYLKNKMDNDN